MKTYLSVFSLLSFHILFRAISHNSLIFNLWLPSNVLQSKHRNFTCSIIYFCFNYVLIFDISSSFHRVAILVQILQVVWSRISFQLWKAIQVWHSFCQGTALSPVLSPMAIFKPSRRTRNSNWLARNSNTWNTIPCRTAQVILKQIKVV